MLNTVGALLNSAKETTGHWQTRLHRQIKYILVALFGECTDRCTHQNSVIHKKRHKKLLFSANSFGSSGASALLLFDICLPPITHQLGRTCDVPCDAPTTPRKMTPTWLWQETGAWAELSRQENVFGSWKWRGPLDEEPLTKSPPWQISSQTKCILPSRGICFVERKSLSLLLFNKAWAKTIKMSDSQVFKSLEKQSRHSREYTFFLRLIRHGNPTRVLSFWGWAVRRCQVNSTDNCVCFLGHNAWYRGRVEGSGQETWREQMRKGIAGKLNDWSFTPELGKVRQFYSVDKHFSCQKHFIRMTLGNHLLLIKRQSLCASCLRPFFCVWIFLRNVYPNCIPLPGICVPGIILCSSVCQTENERARKSYHDRSISRNPCFTGKAVWDKLLSSIQGCFYDISLTVGRSHSCVVQRDWRSLRNGHMNVQLEYPVFNDDRHQTSRSSCKGW